MKLSLASLTLFLCLPLAAQQPAALTQADLTSTIIQQVERGAADPNP